jgi:RHS repeat-associated protein
MLIKMSNTNRILINLIKIVLFSILIIVTAEAQVGEGGGTPDQTNFNLIQGQGGGNFNGALQLNLPVLTIPGRNGLNYTVYLNYQSGAYAEADQNNRFPHIASWVGKGFNIQIGRITRSVVGRPDEQVNSWYGKSSNFNLDDILQGTERGDPDENDGMLQGDVDQSDINEFWDVYYLHMPEGSYRLLPFHHSPDLYGMDQNSYDSFKIQDGRPWRIWYDVNGGVIPNNNSGDKTYLNGHGLNNFTVTKEDGTCYVFGHISNLEITNDLANNTTNRRYTKFPVSWELTEIHSPDYVDANGDGVADDGDLGSWIRIYYDDMGKNDFGHYQKVGLGANAVTYSHMGGNNNVEAQVNYDMSTIERIETPTYVAKFYTSLYSQNSTYSYPGYKLDSVSLIMKHDNLNPFAPDYPLKTIVFTYNPFPALASVQENGATASDNKPPMKFEYYGNLGDSYDSRTFEYYGGSYCLKKITYPEGGTVQYTYEQNNYNWFFYKDDNPNNYVQYPQFVVYYNPNATQYTGARLNEMDISDGMGTTKTWLYQYGEGFKETNPVATNNNWINNYGALACNGVEYRWVKTVLPDNKGSITNYFTTGVSQSNSSIPSGNSNNTVDSREMRPDYETVVNYNGQNHAQLGSNAASHGIIWKTEIKDASDNIVFKTENNYTYTQIGVFGTDYFQDQAIWAKKISYSVTKDGITQNNYIPIYDQNNHMPVLEQLIGATNLQQNTRAKDENYAWACNIGTMYYMTLRNMLSQESDKAIHEIKSWTSDDLGSSYFDIGTSEEVTHWQEIQFGSYLYWNTRYYPFQKLWYKDAESFPQDYVITQDSMQYNNYGNLIESRDGNEIPCATIYAMKGTVPIGIVKNAKYNQVTIANFDDGDVSGWTQPGGGTWNIQNGNYYSSGTNTSSNLSINLNSSSKDIVVEGDVQAAYGQDVILAKYVNSTNYIQFELNFTQQWAGIISLNGGVPVVQTSPYSINNLTWYHIRGDVHGDTVRLYVNGSLIMTKINTSYSIPSGYCALMSDGGASFDNIRFYPANASAISMSYDTLTLNVSCSIDENGNKTFFKYDTWGRVISEMDGKGNLLKSYLYTYSRNTNINDSFDVATPNYIQETIYRSTSDYTTSRKYFDGLGRLIQTQVSFGNDDIINAQTYDAIGNITKVYKPYEINLGNNAHKYDPNFASNSDTYSSITGSGTNGTPYNEIQYFSDPLNRESIVGAPGLSFKIGSNHEKKYAYSMNDASDGLIYGTGMVYKETMWDENQNTTIKYTDQLGFVDATRNALGLTQFSHDIEGRITQSIDPNGLTTNYTYDRLKKLSQKTTPDAGTVNYLYDMNGNLRFVKDANHNSNTPNSVNITTGSSQSSSFPLTMPGKVNLFASPSAGGTGMYCTITIKPHGSSVVLATITSNATTGACSTYVYLPIGTYDYTITIYNGVFANSIQCQAGYEFIYYKYDALNRVTEEGEYNVTSLNADFTQANADNPDFPSSFTNVLKKYFYDNPSTDAMAAGQKNLKGKLSYAQSYRFGNPSDIYYYSYDEMGRVEWTVLANLGWYQKKMTYTYDLQNNITKKDFYDYDYRNLDFYTTYTYDQANRLSTVNTKYGSLASVQEAAYQYFASGQPKRLQLGTAQGVDYRYNERNWLQSINHQNLGAVYNGVPQDPGRDGFDSGLPADKFGEVIGYNNISDIGAAQSAAAQFNGNISWLMYNMSGVNITYQILNPTSLVGYSFGYDNANRLTGANFGIFASTIGGVYNWQNLNNYDANYSYYNTGNFNTLQRYGSSGAIQDNLTYHYDKTGTNQLTSISGSASAAYTYDANGNMLTDTHRGIGFIIYDANNLPVQAYLTNGQQLVYETDVYGNRVRNTISGTSDNFYFYGADGNTEVVCNLPYSSNLTYNILGAGDDNIGQVKVVSQSPTRYYYLKDHLGSIKMTVNTVGAVVGYDDYYPYGAQMNLRCQTASADGRYKFTGKERDASTGLDYFGARYYDSWNGAWRQVDPLKEKYPSLSVYVYSADNPIKFIDVDGMWIYIANLKYSNNPPWSSLSINGKQQMFPNPAEYFNNSQAKYTSTDHLKVGELQSELNGFHDDYKKSGYKVSDFLERTKLSVAIFNGSDEYGKTFRSEYGVIGIGLNQNILGNAKTLEGAFFHELVHAMDSKNDEFQAYAATFAAGYESKESILSRFGDEEQVYEIEKGMPDEFKQYFDGVKLIKDKQDKFIKAYKQYGNGIIK